ncbi:hypothetical protein pv_176 [Pithovirus sibericum]|uniref:Uncharacterized protein n=1 Tax=Pithovirus sibericum TaxID=1450746 RepID=W5S4Q9_9VIRU|nr:hypothetical protein pv_176 [Pithovirus sibericum]AHH01743.1 hypothetical protein pv_176 [Pithovirus sibericum]
MQKHFLAHFLINSLSSFSTKNSFQFPMKADQLLFNLYDEFFVPFQHKEFIPISNEFQRFPLLFINFVSLIWVFLPQTTSENFTQEAYFSKLPSLSKQSLDGNKPIGR